MQIPRKPSDVKSHKTKIKVPKKENDTEIDEIKKDGFGRVVFKTEHVKEELIKQEMSWPPSLLSLAAGTSAIINTSNFELFDFNFTILPILIPENSIH